TITINGHDRRTLDVELWDQMSYSFTGGQLIEGIGDIAYLLPWDVGLCDGFIMGPLRCYEDNVLGLYMRPGILQCDIGTEVAALPSRTPFSVLPSVTTTGGPILVTARCGRFEVLDEVGRVVLQRQVNGLEEFACDGPGMFTVRYVACNGETAALRF